MPGPGAAKDHGSGVARPRPGPSPAFTRVARHRCQGRIRQGDSEGLTITGDDNIVPLVDRRRQGHAEDPLEREHEAPVEVQEARHRRQPEAHRRHPPGRFGADPCRPPQVRQPEGRDRRLGRNRAGRAGRRHASGSIAGSGSAWQPGAPMHSNSHSPARANCRAQLQSRRVTNSVQGSADARVGEGIAERDDRRLGRHRYRGNPQVNRTVAGSGTVRRAKDAT